MKHLFIFVCLSIFLFSSCNERENNRNNMSNNTSEPIILSMDDMLSDTTKMVEINFPVYFDSTRVLVHPIGFINVNTKDDMSIGDRITSKTEDYRKSSSGDSHFYAYNAGDRISGSITNLYFDDVDNKSQCLLTDKVLNINGVEYLRGLSKVIGKDYLIYNVYDQDTNNDGKLNGNDVLACYISNLNGKDFKKITPDNQQYVPGVWVLWASRYYFKTIEDTNKNGQFDEKDKAHYYYIDFSTTPYTVLEYNPLTDK